MKTAAFGTVGSQYKDNLLAGDFPRIERMETILSGAGELEAGAVLAQDSENDNKLVLVDSGSETDSVQAPYAVLMHDVDATASDVQGFVYLAGHLNELELSFGGTDTAETHRAALRQLGIYLGENIPA